MIDEVATFCRSSERVDIAKVSGDELDREILEVISTACRSHETSDLFTTFEQNSDEVRSDEPGSACDKCFHEFYGVRQISDE